MRDNNERAGADTALRAVLALRKAGFKFRNNVVSDAVAEKYDFYTTHKNGLEQRCHERVNDHGGSFHSVYTLFLHSEATIERIEEAMTVLSRAGFFVRVESHGLSVMVTQYEDATI